MRSLALLLAFIPALLHADDPRPLSRIGFGSCVHQDKPQPIWEKIVDAKPEFFIMLGDNIYADVPKDTVMEEAYAKLAQQKGFQALRKLCPMMVTWDDHDYGLNDAGVEYAHKEKSRELLLKFFNEPADSPRWKQPGIYEARIIGPPGKRVQIITLDGRFNRSALKKGRRGSDPNFPRVEPYLPNTDPDATFLGETQWKWLEEQLRKPAEIRLLGSGIQVVSEDHIFEKWMTIPKERERLFHLIRDTKANGVIFLSGDRHLADLSAMDGGVGYTLYDLTASGFNQASTSYRPAEKNRHRVAGLSWGNHFGFIEIDWSKSDPLIRLQIRDEDGEIAFQHKVPLSALVPDDGKVEKPVGPGAISTAEAAKKVGENVTVEMLVKRAGASGKRIFLNSETNRNDEKNFVIMIDMDKAGAKFKEAKIDEPGKHFTGKTIRVTGKVALYQNKPEIIVTDPEQIKISEK